MRTSSSTWVPGSAPETVVVAIGGTSLLVVLYAGVEPRVRDVGDQVEENDEKGDQYEVAHQERKIELSQCVVEEPPHTGPRKDRLRHDGASDEVRRRERNDGHDGDECVLQAVP